MRSKFAIVAVVAVATAMLGTSAVTAARDAGEGWFVVRFAGPIRGTDHAALVERGASAIHYLPTDSYVAWLAEGPVPTRGLASVQQVRELRPSEKLDASLAGVDGPVPTVAVVYGNSLRRAVRAIGSWATVTSTRSGQRDGLLHEVTLVADGAQRQRLLDQREVRYVGPAPTVLTPEDEGTAQIVAGQVPVGQPPSPGYRRFLADLHLDGSGVRMSVVDTGIDERHPDLAGRVAARVDYRAATVTGGPSDAEGHGTHVAGIAAGNGSAFSTTGGAKDSRGLLYGLGTAPGLELVDQNAIATGRDLPGWPSPSTLEKVSSDAVANGAVGWNGSWQSGEGPGVGYVETARALDQLVRDADWKVSGAQPFTMVFSAGNEGGGGAFTITAPKEAKNIITVGSSLSHRSDISPLAQPDTNAIAGSSSRGPARDGRILPTLVAPGTGVASTRSQSAVSHCTTPPIDGNSWGVYSLCSGTSMSAAHVSGAVGLVHQWWRGFKWGANPSPAMVKALLVNTATDLGAPDVPNNSEGWGRLELSGLLDSTDQRIYVDQAVLFNDPGASRTLTVRVSDPSRPLKVSLVWTDAPGGPGSNPALVNDLDLTVTAPDGRTFRGNAFSAGRSVSWGGPDRRNNVENVFLPPSHPPGSYDITVSAHNLPGDGVPFRGDATDQDYALVISNAVPG